MDLMASNEQHVYVSNSLVTNPFIRTVIGAKARDQPVFYARKEEACAIILPRFRESASNDDGYIRKLEDKVKALQARYKAIKSQSLVPTK
ncbi:hypothetical protein EAF04_003051 [Stromatinia cepivora]|nr:hypothetical protein EAF04_003051 [Stromatinia cepivora]